MDEEERASSKLPKLYDIPLSLIDDFPAHPFKVRIDEDMDQLVESIKKYGLITPVILRTKEPGRYEMISGHRRKIACIRAGLTTITAEIRELTQDEAIILMVDSNMQRTTVLPSEKAFSYKMRLEALKQESVLDQICSFECMPSHAQTIRMRKLSQRGELDDRTVIKIMKEEKPNQADMIRIPYNEIRQYIPRSVSYEKTADYIKTALKFYQEHHSQNHS